jgi:putative tricarboxylic transport membrane protein
MLADRVILACTIAVAVIYLYAATLIPTLAIGDPLGPKAFPRLLGIALLIAAGFLAMELWRGRDRSAEEPKTEPAAPLFEGNVIAVLGVVAIWTGAYYLLFEPLGYILATAAYLLPMMAWFNRGRWVANVLSTVFFVAFTYFLFVKLEVRLPQGVLPI